MKKITIILFFLLSFLGFSQNPLEKIRSYVNENRSKLALTSQDISDLVIVNEFSSESTGINNYHVKQRHQGIEVFNSDSNFWIKNDNVINGGEEFIANINQKINSTTPNISVVNGVSNALTQIDGTSSSIQILESSSNKYKLSIGNRIEDPVRAQLVYFLTETNTLRLAWDYEFYSQDYNHLWSLKVDATDGKVLDKKDLVLSCSFDGNHNSHDHYNKQGDFFTKSFLKDSSALAMTPGNTQYRVIPFNYESPNHSAFQLISNPESTAVASPNGWHNASTAIGGATTTYNYTRGNNAFAYSDYLNDNPSAPATFANASAGVYPNLTFDYPYPGTGVVATSYINTAITNLFYLNNVMHDLWYQYGFDEVNKNFQTANYGRGGAGNDAVRAEAQDASQGNNNPILSQGQVAGVPLFNNANFGAPTDGSAPRMQMYLWNQAPPPTLTINSPASVAGNYTIADNGFSPGHVVLTPAGITQDLVLFNDGTPDNTDGCTAATNAAALNGKIAVIRRGTCSFVIKVKAAQNAGAVAVIIVNNAAGGAALMGGADATITIPAVNIAQAEGEALIAAMGTGTVNGKLSGPAPGFVNSDGDFDNGIIAHEYGHGISQRLSGNCLGGSEQMGEGWSDWFWLMMQIKPGDTRNDAKGIGTFASNQATNGGGIRPFKYSTDMAVNPQTYSSTNTAAVPHGIGSIWATILWDLTWDYIDKYGYNSNIYTGTGGNNKLMRLVLDAIKLDGCNPTFITGRDALIAADQATTGGQNFCLIWKVFARRGVGVGASSGTTGSITDQVQSFTEPAAGPNCTLGINYFESEDMINIYPNPSNGLVNIRISQFTGKVNLQVIDLNGRVVYSLNDADFNVEKSINLDHLQSGMYVVKINGSELNYTKKIILN